MTDNIEILAPAGDMQCFEAAVANGADAVYLGGKQFSARKSASNFDNTELEYAVDYAHLRGVKVYVALNTLVHDDEIESCFEFIRYCYIIGVDALIVQDLGLVHILRKYFPDFRIHASTQMTVHNSLGVSEAARLGFSRVVLSRELSYEEIKAVTDKKICETEVFAHGALCMCYSGQCLMSSFIGGRSGNRGACAQPCRLKYTVCDSDKNPIGISERYYMSLKDLCLVDEIARLKELDVTSLKIEGRMKSSEYVSIVTSMYNKYRNGEEADRADISTLENVFSRSGFTKGYVHGKTGVDMLNVSKNNDDIYKNISKDVHDIAKELMDNSKTAPVSVYISVKLGEKPYLILSGDDFSVSATGDNPVEAALKSATDADRIFRQISKFGGTAFCPVSVEGDIDEGINIPISVLNDLRRRAVELVENEITSRFKRNCTVLLKEPGFIKNSNQQASLSATVRTLDQAMATYDAGFDRIFVPYRVYVESKDFFDSNADVFALKLPSIMREGWERSLSDIKLDCISVANISQISLFKDKKLHADYSMNIYNSYSVAKLKKIGFDSFCLSPELNIGQMRDVKACIDSEIIVYGNIPLMTVRNCLLKSASGRCCCNEDNVYHLCDRTGTYFPFVTDRENCVNTVYNSVPIYMGDKMSQLNSLGCSWHRFDFTFEDAKDIPVILDMYINGKAYKDKNFTRGHYYRGVI